TRRGRIGARCVARLRSRPPTVRAGLPARTGLLLSRPAIARAIQLAATAGALRHRGAHRRQGARRPARSPPASANGAVQPCRCRTPTCQSLRSSPALLSGYAGRFTVPWYGARPALPAGLPHALVTQPPITLLTCLAVGIVDRAVLRRGRFGLHLLRISAARARRRHTI